MNTQCSWPTSDTVCRSALQSLSRRSSTAIRWDGGVPKPIREAQKTMEETNVNECVCALLQHDDESKLLGDECGMWKRRVGAAVLRDPLYGGASGRLN